MKKIIATILKTGYTKSRKPLTEFIHYLYPLKHILKVNELGWVTCNDNSFWKPENNQNRTELLHDICSIQKRNIKDSSYFHIINRFENGDKYGIEII